MTNFRTTTFNSKGEEMRLREVNLRRNNRGLTSRQIAY